MSSFDHICPENPTAVFPINCSINYRKVVFIVSDVGFYYEGCLEVITVHSSRKKKQYLTDLNLTSSTHRLRGLKLQCRQTENEMLRAI